jgi:hypothetical protein
MSAEINHWFADQEGPQDFDGDFLEDPGIFWLSGFGDGQGNETFVMAQEDVVIVITGKLLERAGKGDDGDYAKIRPVRQEASLQLGERHSQLLYSPDKPPVLMSIKNIGSTAIDPRFN